ncbi:MAG TPA: GNAT family N-acetyltransferase [Myxococcaceae bacterium]|nr:GNAT family N-acetyltransferase [Myxococcaceae bacterium]
MRWRIEGRGDFRVERGTPQLLRQVDAEWLGLKHDDDDPSVSWAFHELGRKRNERFVVLDEDGRTVAAWLDHDQLVNVNAYRLDFFKVRPDMQGRGLGLFVFGLIWRRAQERGAERIVFQAVPRSEKFYRAKVGATECTDWKGHGALPNLQVEAEALRKLEGILDGYRIER